jgi:SulP family sulfate permease
MLATVTFDLTQAIIIGIMFSLVLFLNKVSNLEIVPTEVDWNRLRQAGFEVTHELSDIRVVYISGSLFFGAVGQFVEKLEDLPHTNALILSMRGVPMLDVSGLHAIEHIWQRQLKQEGLLLVTGLQPQVAKMCERGGLVEKIGKDKFFWGADQAIQHACQLLLERPASEWDRDLSIDTEVEDEMPFGVVKVE